VKRRQELLGFGEGVGGLVAIFVLLPHFPVERAFEHGDKSEEREEKKSEGEKMMMRVR
jgi:hypothetical protein